MRFAQFEQIPIVGHQHGGSYVDGPWRWIVHTTEGGTIESNVAGYGQDGWFPHFTADPYQRRCAQHIDTDESATAVDHKSSWPFQTNRLHAIQVELVGQAVKMPLLPDDALRWLGEFMFRPVCKAHGVTFTCPKFVAYPASYGSAAPQRFTPNAWEDFNGVCGHQHVPWNLHGDPGAIEMEKILAYARGVPGPTPTPVPKPPEAPLTTVALAQVNPNGRTPTARPDTINGVVLLENGATVKDDKPGPPAGPEERRQWRHPKVQDDARLVDICAVGGSFVALYRQSDGRVVTFAAQLQ